MVVLNGFLVAAAQLKSETNRTKSTLRKHVSAGDKTTPLATSNSERYLRSSKQRDTVCTALVPFQTVWEQFSITPQKLGTLGGGSSWQDCTELAPKTGSCCLPQAPALDQNDGRHPGSCDL